MKWAWVLPLSAALLLTACAAEQGPDRVEALQRRYAESGGCEACVTVEVPREEENLRFALKVQQNTEETRLTLVEPTEVAGIAAVVSDDEKLSLQYEGSVLDAGSVRPGVSALNSVSILLRAASEGYVVERSEEAFEGVKALRLGIETECAGEKLLCTAFFDEEDCPLYAELEQDGKILSYLRFTAFSFDGIITAETGLQNTEANPGGA